jgi:hypothetical protein
MNSTPSPTSRFGLWFLTGTAVFLAVTASLKLYSGLLETKVLETADPLLPFFTVRQMMFLAALLELAVAFVLFRRQHAETAPWLVLWLVGVFAAYRVGLWAVGFQGHCSCLGHVLDFLPGVWLDRLMVASLGAMGLGSLWTIRYQPIERSSCQSLVGQVGILIGLFGLLVPATAAASSPITAIEIEGRLVYEVYDDDGSVLATHIKEFRCLTAERLWRIQTWDPAEPERLSTTGFDGTNVFAVVDQPKAHAALPDAESADPKAPKRATDTAIVHVGIQPDFDWRSMIPPIWFAYCSSSALSSAPQMRLRPIWFHGLFEQWSADTSWHEATIRYFSSHPHLPREARFVTCHPLPSLPVGSEVARFSVSETHSLDRAVWPRSFELQKRLPPPGETNSSETLPTARWLGTASAFRSVSVEPPAFVPVPGTSCLVRDYRVKVDESLRPVRYLAKSAWPATNSVAHREAVRAALHLASPPRRKGPAPWVRTVGFTGMLLAVSVTVFLLRRRHANSTAGNRY